MNEALVFNKICIIKIHEIHTNKTQKGNSHEKMNIQTRYNIYYWILAITDLQKCETHKKDKELPILAVRPVQ